MRIKKRYTLRSDKLREYHARIDSIIDTSFLKKNKNHKWECIEFDEDFTIIALNGDPFLIVDPPLCYPHLRSIHLFTVAAVVVDQGAIPYVCNGADIMYAGIVQFDMSIHVNDIVVVREEKFQKEIAIGKSFIDARFFDKKKKGKAVMNLHYVGDKKWGSVIT